MAASAAREVRVFYGSCAVRDAVDGAAAKQVHPQVQPVTAPRARSFGLHYRRPRFPTRPL